MKEVDARGYSCPEPVIFTKRALASDPQEIVVLVDNDTSKINVERFLRVAGYHVQITHDQPNEYILKGTKK
ncbi:sulfurtransferase TusA family protein [Dehalobacter sp. DCM]|uniref:sulfurtransferase TusA family protein n=1 Tax=Dehalobacter sp. DCM TaxID=2907827 RepID=UPI0030814E68|nr:sulfurtransferase TusA family protein [Dehalobacter sp. DCM]